MLADVLQAQPKDAIEYSIAWLQKEQERRKGGAGAGGAQARGSSASDGGA